MTICVENDEENVPFLQLGSHILRLDLEELGEKDKEIAAQELKETPENVNHGLSKLREIIRAEPNLYVPLDDDKFLMKFLRPCRFKPDVAFKIMKKFYKFKVKYPKYGQKITPSGVRQVYDSEVYQFLPTRCSGARIMIINVGTKWNPKENTLEDLFKALMVAIEIAMMEPKTQLYGVHVILDVGCLSLAHICEFSPMLAKIITTWVQDCAPTRLKGIHVINQPYIFNMLYAIFKPFIGEKLRNWIVFHGSNKETLVEKMSADCLPEYLGGVADIPEYPGSLFSDMLFFYEDEFKVYNTYGYRVDKEKA